jgi:hypothetical protein
MKRFFILTTFFLAAFSIGAQDLVSGGSNSWIFHTPDDGRKSLHIAPKTNGKWDWGKQITLFNDGKMHIRRYLGIRTASPSAVLDVNGTALVRSTLTARTIKVSGTDFVLGSGGTRSIGTKPHQRALVHGNDDVLEINYGGDFEGGLRIHGTKSVFHGNVGIRSTLTARTIKVSGTDFVLGSGGARSIGTKPHQRALVHGNDDVLVINYGGDFEGGLRIHGTKSVFHGNVGIGTKNPDEKLTVKGKIHAKEVKVDVNIPADYVFQKYYTGTSSLKDNYTLPTLEYVETFTKKNHHLPEVPSAKEIQKNGLHLKQMTNLLLQKIEELTLYTIEQEKKLKKQETERIYQSKKNLNLEKRLARLESLLQKSIQK